MQGPRYWWQEPVDDVETLVAEPSAPPHPARSARHTPIGSGAGSLPQGERERAPDLDRLRVYRSELIRKASLRKRGSASRKAVEARLVKVTADILKLELRGQR